MSHWRRLSASLITIISLGTIGAVAVAYASAGRTITGSWSTDVIIDPEWLAQSFSNEVVGITAENIENTENTENTEEDSLVPGTTSYDESGKPENESPENENPENTENTYYSDPIRISDLYPELVDVVDADDTELDDTELDNIIPDEVEEAEFEDVEE